MLSARKLAPAQEPKRRAAGYVLVLVLEGGALLASQRSRRSLPASPLSRRMVQRQKVALVVTTMTEGAEG